MSLHPLTSQPELEPGQLLDDLEQRQDEVLAQLDELDAKLTAVLKSLGATLDDDGESGAATAPPASTSDAADDSADKLPLAA